MRVLLTKTMNCKWQRGVWCTHPNRKYDECILTVCENYEPFNPEAELDALAARNHHVARGPR